MILKNRKKAQEEMVGFVLIIVLVAVIALILFAIGIRKPKEEGTSRDIDNFLSSALLFTTECKPSLERNYDLKDLIKACYEGEDCLSGEKACNVLNKTANNLIKTSWEISEESKERGYIFKIYQKNENLIYLSKGEETSIKLGGEVFIPVSRDNLYMRLELFY